MNKEQHKRVTFEQLIARKIQRENDKIKTKMIYIPCLDSTMLFKKISDDTVLDILDDVSDDTQRRAIINAYKKIIYLCCEDLQNPDLHEKMDIIDPYDIIDALFGVNDIIKIGDELMKFLDLDAAAEEIKN